MKEISPARVKALGIRETRFARAFEFGVTRVTYVVLTRTNPDGGIDMDGWRKTGGEFRKVDAGHGPETEVEKSVQMLYDTYLMGIKLAKEESLKKLSVN